MIYYIFVFVFCFLRHFHAFLDLEVGMFPDFLRLARLLFDHSKHCCYTLHSLRFLLLMCHLYTGNVSMIKFSIRLMPFLALAKYPFSFGIRPISTFSLRPVMEFGIRP